MERVSPGPFSFVFQAADSLCYKLILMILKRKAVGFIADDQAVFPVGFGLVLDVTSILEARLAKVAYPRIDSQSTSCRVFRGGFCLFYISFRTALCNYRKRGHHCNRTCEENADELTQTVVSKVLALL